MELFSDREYGRIEANKEIIDIPVWNAVVSIFEGFVADRSLARDFPEQCPDNLGIIGFDRYNFEHFVRATIPDLEVPIRTKRELRITDSDPWGVPEISKAIVVPDQKGTIAILDFIEFCYAHLYDAVPGPIHTYFQHHHYTFPTSDKAQARFRDQINYLFQRNGIAFELSEQGKIQRLLPAEFHAIIRKNYQTRDANLNQLLQEAAAGIHLPSIEDRKVGLDRLWDAFERAKTFYGTNKRMSADQLLNEMAVGDGPIKLLLNEEANQLTIIGNQFQIRHYETDKHPLVHVKHIDYLFFRMYAFVHLMMETLGN